MGIAPLRRSPLTVAVLQILPHCYQVTTLILLHHNGSYYKQFCLPFTEEVRTSQVANNVNICCFTTHSVDSSTIAGFFNFM